MAEEKKAPPPPQPSLSQTLSIFLMLLAVFVMLDETMRQGFGNAASTVLNPALGFGGSFPLLTILAAGLLTSAVSTLLRHRMTDWVKLARGQKISRALSKQLMEAMRKGDRARMEKIRGVQKEATRDTFQASMSQFKVMPFTFLPFILVFVWLDAFVRSAVSDPTFAVPWSPAVSLTGATGFPHWLLLYMVLAIPFSTLLGKVLRYLSFSRRLASEPPGVIASSSR